MTEPEVLDPETEEETEVIVAPPALAVTPQVTAHDLVARLDTIKAAQQTAMVPDVDYGVIPGTDKPTLFKPGSEKLAVLFQLDVQLANEKVWGPGEHLTVISRATVYHAPTGSRLGYGEGVCTTKERKYAYRKQERTCPTCGAAAVIKGKEEFGGGWLCWKKRNGCGAKWPDGAEEIESQETGEIDNPDLPDLWNTVVKMAEKRARVDAVLAVTGASALFTQDLEDAVTPSPEPVPDGLASPGQKGGLSRKLNSAGIHGETQKAIVHAIAGDPPTVDGLDRVSQLLAEGGAAKLYEVSRVELPPDQPDTSDLPPAGEDRSDEGGTLV